MIENKKVLITGGAGFIGCSLARRILPHCKVVILDNFRRDALSRSDIVGHPNLTIIKGDVLDADLVREAVRGCDYVVHMAAIAGVDTVMKNPVLTMRVALLGTINVIDAAFQEGKVERLIDFSTSEVCGQYAYKVGEGEPTNLGAVGEARWTYAVSKLATEHLALSYHRQYGFPATSIRPFNVYGPNQVGEGAIHRFVRSAIAGEDLIVHNDGSQIRSWCYIDDIVDGILLVMTHKSAIGEAFNIGNPRSTVTIFNLARDVIRLAHSSSSIRHVKWDFPDVEVRIPNIDKARKLLGFEPKIDLEEGLLRTINWYRGK